MSVGLLVLIVLVVLLLGGFRDWGYGPFYGVPYGGPSIGFILLVVLILVLLGRL